MQASRNTKGWFKIDISEDHFGGLGRCYSWITTHCKGQFQVSALWVKFEKETDAVYFGIGFK